MCWKESCGAIAVPMEAHMVWAIPQRGQPPRMHGPGLWKYGQKEQSRSIKRREPDLGCPKWNNKDLRGILGRAGPTKFRFLQANFREISIFSGNFIKNFDFSGNLKNNFVFSGKNCSFTGLFLGKLFYSLQRSPLSNILPVH